jgi:hypothetical protein
MSFTVGDLFRLESAKSGKWLAKYFLDTREEIVNKPRIEEEYRDCSR